MISTSPMQQRIRMLLTPLLLLLMLLTIFRLIFWIVFKDTVEAQEFSSVLYAFFLGLKFDLRLSLLLLVPFCFSGAIKTVDPLRCSCVSKLWINHLSILALALGIFFCIDLVNYDYLAEHLDVSALRYLQNPLISLGMVWESYPVIWMAAGLGVFVYIFHWILTSLLPMPLEIQDHEQPDPPWKRRLFALAVVLACLGGIYGKFSYYPLRWSDAFFSNEKIISDVAVNPVLFFIDTLSTAEQEIPYDKEKMAEHYDQVSSYLGVEKVDSENFHFARYVQPTPLSSEKLNVVLIFLESFAAHRTGAFGNPLNPSPYFDAIAAKSVLFRHFYTPRGGTARGVFATLTGIPDTITYRTASRNPRTVTQNTILRSFEGYRKFYFLGGSANWANIRALFTHNHKEFEIYEEGSYQSDRADVWGIPDYYLFEEANGVLQETGKDREPFFAFIHLSGNHRPYTIPSGIPGFELWEKDEDILLENGFESLAEYNSFRFLDFSLGHFFELAQKQDYFENTIFMIFSDNGSPGRNKLKPPCEATFRLGVYHSPLAIYAPAFITDGKIMDTMASQLDVMPTAAGLAGIPALNTTMGRNLFDPRFQENSVAFISRTQGAEVEILTRIPSGVCLTTPYGEDGSLYDCSSGQSMDATVSESAKVVEQRNLAQGLYHTSKYMLYNNKSSFYDEAGWPLSR